MDSLEIKLLNMLKLGKSMYDINKELGISTTEIYKLLFDIKNKYKMFEDIIFNNGIQYTNFYNLFGNSNTYLNMEPHNNRIRLMLVSDLHLGNHNDSVKAINLMYDYVIANKINVILNLGDFFEGATKNKTCKFDDCHEQISYALEKYPSDKSVTNFLLLGNHDISLMLDKKIDIKKIVEERRKDIVITGIGRSNLFLNDFRFRLDHETNRYPVEPSSSFNNGIILKGHSHKYKVISSYSSMSISLPSLSDVLTNQYSCYFPSLIDMTLHFKNSMINNITLMNYIVLYDELMLMNEQRITVEIEKNSIFLDKEQEKKKQKIINI